jgi:carbonic anhydrase
MVSSSEALERLKDGNHRFAAGESTIQQASDVARRQSLTEGQVPFAVILGCSDSRVPSEIVFDQGLGDLFVIRVAGNIVAPSQIGSVEFAASQFGCSLVVVMGHENCGAIHATVNSIQDSGQEISPNIMTIVDRIRPAVESVVNDDRDLEHDKLVEKAVRANVQASVSNLSHGSEILEQMIRKGSLQVVGAEYSLTSGKVEFFS